MSLQGSDSDSAIGRQVVAGLVVVPAMAFLVASSGPLVKICPCWSQSQLAAEEVWASSLQDRRAL